jgi:transporter family-2 protein
MKVALRNALVNPGLASLVSFLPVVAFLSVMIVCMPRAPPTIEGLTAMRWWAPLGGLIGAGAVVVGLLFVQQVGAGTVAGLTITANILVSLLIDKFGWFGMEAHALSGPDGRGGVDGGRYRTDLEILKV